MLFSFGWEEKAVNKFPFNVVVISTYVYPIRETGEILLNHWVFIKVLFIVHTLFSNCSVVHIPAMHWLFLIKGVSYSQVSNKIFLILIRIIVHFKKKKK